MTNPLAPAWLSEPADANALDAGIWSNGTVRGESGVVSVAGSSVIDLAHEFGTPLYVFDEADVLDRAGRIRDALNEACAQVGTRGIVYYASKAFLSGAVASWMVDSGLRVDVASAGELELALAAGVPAARIGLHGNNKSDAELARAAEVGVGSLVIDSADEVERVARAARAAGAVLNVRLRVNTGVHASTHEYLATAREDQKFGVALRDAAEIVAAIRAHDSLNFLGLHSHIGSQIFAADGFHEAARRLLDVHHDLLASGPVPELNLGGGFGIAYTRADDAADVPSIISELVAGVAAQCAERGIDVPVIAIEPGRAIVGTGGMTLYTVGTVKPVDVTDENGNAGTRTYVSVDGGMSDNMRTALYHADYSVTLASRSSDVEPVLVRIVGKHCESGDVVVRDAYLPGDVRAGDILAVATTGAYCYSLSNNYNALARPAVVSVDDGSASVIVRRETFADMFSRDTQLGRNTP